MTSLWSSAVQWSRRSATFFSARMRHYEQQSGLRLPSDRPADSGGRARSSVGALLGRAAPKSAAGAALRDLPHLAVWTGVAVSPLPCFRSRMDRGRTARPHFQLGEGLASLPRRTQAAWP